MHNSTTLPALYLKDSVSASYNSSCAFENMIPDFIRKYEFLSDLLNTLVSF